MEKYQVIIVLDETRERSYFYSYVQSEDTTLGNIECTELPPYADINKARSCYWNAEESIWVFDEEKYNEIITHIEEEKLAQEEAEAIAEATPTNIELSEIVMELAGAISDITDAVTELGDYVASVDERLTTIEESMEG